MIDNEVKNNMVYIQKRDNIIIAACEGVLYLIDDEKFEILCTLDFTSILGDGAMMNFTTEEIDTIQTHWFALGSQINLIPENVQL